MEFTAGALSADKDNENLQVTGTIEHTVMSVSMKAWIFAISLLFRRASTEHTIDFFSVIHWLGADNYGAGAPLVLGRARPAAAATQFRLRRCRRQSPCGYPIAAVG